jgi:hypothetical protein
LAATLVSRLAIQSTTRRPAASGIGQQPRVAYVSNEGLERAGQAGADKLHSMSRRGAGQDRQHGHGQSEHQTDASLDEARRVAVAGVTGSADRRHPTGMPLHYLGDADRT